MAIRYNILIYLFCIIAVNGISSADIIIKKNTTWTRNRTLSENVIVQPNSVLTINAGVNIYVQNRISDDKDTTRVQILVLGALNILGSADDLVYIGPRGTLSEKNYWAGVKLESSHSKSNLDFLKISNAEKGLDIKSPIKVSNTEIQFCSDNGIYVESNNNDLVEIENVSIRHCDNVSLLIEKGTVSLDWVDISRGGGIGLVNNTYGMVTINNMKVNQNLDNGIVNYGHLTASNILISQNRHGVVLSPGISIITYADIINNRSNGILVGGGSKVNMEYCTIQTNGGYGLELTDWSENGHLNSWTKTSRPVIEISNSNFIDNYKTTVLDNFKYDNIWSNWSGIEYSGSGWVNNFERKIKREVPFGRIGWIGFDYNSNDGGNEFSWQPCTGKSVWSPVFEVQNSRDQTLTYLNAPFQCGWNSLAGKNSNSWVKYGKHTGLIDSTEQYVDWSVKKMNLVSSNDYYLKHYFKSTYLPSDDSVLVVKPAVENFQLRFYHGGEEISSYSNNDDVSLNNNYWSSSKNEKRLINPHGKSDVAIKNQITSLIETGLSNLSKSTELKINSPTKGLAYQEVKNVEITWDTHDWVPLVNLHVSVDGGANWSLIEKHVPNKGKYDWWNNLIVGDKFFIKVEDSFNKDNSNVAGPCKVIVNKTPLIQVSTKTLNFITEKNTLEFSIINNGGGLLMWSLSANESWLYFDRRKGSTKKQSNCTVKVKRSGLKTGKYYGNINIQSNAGSKVIPVELIVAKPSLYVDTKYLSFDSTKAAQTFNIRNFGGGTLTWSIDPAVKWIKAVPNEGIVQSATSVKILIDRSKLKIGENEAKLTLKTNVGEQTIDLEAIRLKSFIQDTIRTDFSPWHWMYQYEVY